VARKDLIKLVQAFEDIEFRSNADVVRYSRITRAIGAELYLRMNFHAAELEARLGKYKGRWYHFGITSRVRARLVAARLKIGAEGFKAAGVAGVKMAAAFEKHFVQPEREARRSRKRTRAGGFTVDVDDRDDDKDKADD
jgi:hypothetical protein